jgi:hypothetical protein
MGLKWHLKKVISPLPTKRIPDIQFRKLYEIEIFPVVDQWQGLTAWYSNDQDKLFF